ncbi:Uu.00g012860.m01.CDS01 [Anthostomella pinea]|uniref:Uu.00g012860.m01.CDS01 n=1 Tax=Anthostomella pinea TaxID=933095 RepID=A0AAI8VY33_9PEZI|nr:Uu.00g012860.m01.CDS01 [Anthostomella pinea]
MASSALLRKNMLKQSGFFFRTGNLFSSEPLAGKVYEALLGRAQQRHSSLDEAKNQVAELIQQLFSGCMHHDVLYRALRGGEIFWSAVSAEWRAAADLEASDVREIVEIFVQAR